jgi:glycosyltransferase involved in cell wall biosynthesis
MRILVVADYYRHGTARVIEDRAAALVRRGHQVALLAGADGERIGAERDEARLLGLEPELIPYAGGPRGPRDLLRLGGEFRRGLEKLREGGRFQAVVFNQPLSAWAIQRSTLLSGAASLYTFHSPWAAEWAISRGFEYGASGGRTGIRPRLEYAARRWIEGRALAGCDRITLLSEYMRCQLREVHPRIPERKTVLIPGGVDLARFRPSSPEARRARKAALGIPLGSRLLLTVRRLVPRMGLSMLLEAFRRLAGEFPELILAIGGSGPLEGTLRATARALGMSERVRLLGYVPEVQLPGLYAAADLFVLPTLELEGFGLVTVEALASGTPVIGSPVGATPEILGRIDRRLLAETPTAAGLARAVRSALVLDPSELGELARLARTRMVDLYDAERVGEALEELLLALATPARSRRPRARRTQREPAAMAVRKFVRDREAAIE